jgi:hypothetical protein
MKRSTAKPIGARSRSKSIQAEAPERLKKLSEDPEAVKRNTTGEQCAAFVKPGVLDDRVKANESDQGRTV